MRHVLMLAFLLSLATPAFSQPLKIKEVYGIKIGTKADTLSYITEKDRHSKNPVPGTVRMGIDFEKSGLSKPSPLLRDENAWGFVLVDTSTKTVIGVGIATTTVYGNTGREMQTALRAKCEDVTEYPPMSHQGADPFGRPRLGEMQGRTEDDLIMTFTDRQVNNSVVNVMRLTYIDRVLAERATKNSVKDSGF